MIETFEVLLFIGFKNNVVPLPVFNRNGWQLFFSVFILKRDVEAAGMGPDIDYVFSLFFTFPMKFLSHFDQLADFAVVVDVESQAVGFVISEIEDNAFEVFDRSIQVELLEVVLNRPVFDVLWFLAPDTNLDGFIFLEASGVVIFHCARRTVIKSLF